MTQEFKIIVETAQKWKKQGLKTVLASVVDLEGSSYRRPGVRMLLADNGQSIGAVSGGCVEKDVLNQSRSIFEDGKSKMMLYDGRLRLGCEGVIYILIEPFELSDQGIKAFEKSIELRTPMKLISNYKKEFGIVEGMGSSLIIDKERYALNQNATESSNLSVFEQQLDPLFQLLIIGAEHDAVQLSNTASNLGWEVTVMAAPDEQKSIEYFKGATRLITPLFDSIDTSVIDRQTAVVLMTHSFNKDVQYLMALEGVLPAYFGVLGPKHRKERLLQQLLEFKPEVDIEFVDQLRGPVGIDIGAESAVEISISIIAEILSVVRDKNPILLKDKEGTIHG